MKKLLLLLMLCPITLFSQWVQQEIPSNINMILTLDFADVNNGVAGGWEMNLDFSGRLIYTTNSGTNWNISQLPDSSRAIVKVQMINSSTGYIAGAYNTVFADNGNRHFYNPKAYSRSALMKNHYSRIGITGDASASYRGMFLKTTNGGQSWNLINTLPSNVYYLLGMRFANVNTGFISAMMQYSPQGHTSILKTTNGGLAWQNLVTLDSADLGNVSTTDGVNVFSVGWGRNGTTFDGYILYSNNGGTNWLRQDFTNTISGIEDINFMNSSTGFAVSLDDAFKAMVLKTTNSGLNWTRLSFQPLNTHYYGIEFAGTTGKGIAVGSYGTQFNRLIISRTTDYGNNWTNYNINDSMEFYSQHLIDQNNWFACGGFYSGLIYKSANGGAIGIRRISTEVPRTFFVYQNYPNPFNPSTKIKFDVPPGGKGNTSDIKIVLYDITGRQVAVLLNESLNPGTYEMTFDASGYSSGVYFYKLEAGDFVQTKRMVLVK